MYLFIDTETTGLYDFKSNYNASHQPYIVQIAIILCEYDGRELFRMSSLVLPDGWSEIEEMALSIHGFSVDDCQRYGMKIETLMGILAMMSSRATYLVGHNIDYDLKMSLREILRLDSGSREGLEALTPICTMKGSTDYCALDGRFPGKYKWPSLEELTQKLFGHGVEGAHDAFFDLRATVEAFFELKKIGVLNEE